MATWTGLSFRRGAGDGRLLDDPARLELLGPEMLRAEAAAARLRAARAPASERPGRHLEHARLLREHGERAGAPESLARAARAAEAAGGREGALEGALAALAAAALGGEAALLDAADARLAEFGPAVQASPAARAAAASAQLRARRALADGRPDAGLAAAAACDGAVAGLARLVRREPGRTPELIRARLDRAELLVGFALRLRDAAPAARAAADMADLLPRMDPDRLPVLAGRAARLRGEALTAEGELLGCPRRLGEASRLLQDALAALPSDHAPVERARVGRALGHAARALAEACEDGGAADLLLQAAVSAFEGARASLEGAAVPPLTAQLAFERAGALAARALHGAAGEDAARQAETALRYELMRLDARREPAAWAAVQVALARLYAARGGAGRRAQAALALAGALEVFAEEGLAGLADQAAAALRELRPA